MAKNKLTDLRDHLFETIEALKDEEKPMDIARAKAIADVSRTVIEIAKVELTFYETTGETRNSRGLLPDGKREGEDSPRPQLRRAT